MDRNNIVGWEIRQIRIQKGLTAHQLSSALPNSSPLTSEQITQIELGTRRILDYQVQAISQALGVRLSELFGTPPRKRLPKQEP
jgi:transcriptional regulator with XRE-family HTH domain